MARRKTRMYEPWGYREENNYQSDENIIINDLESFFADTSYNKDDNKIHFFNKDGEEKATIDVSEFVKSDSIIDKVEYNDGILKITFTNGDVITINLSELLDENEFKDGLIVDNHTIKVLIDSTGEPYLSVSENGVKISGIDAAIKVETDRAKEVEVSLNTKIENEISRATSAESVITTNLNNEIARATEAEGILTTKINQEIQDRKDDVDAEEARAKAAEQTITTNLANEVTRATQTEQGLNHRIDVLNDELDAEESARESKDSELSLRVTTEITDRVAAVNAEKNRAEGVEQTLNTRIDNEIARASSAETELQSAIEDEGRRASGAERTLNLKIEAESERAIAKELELDERIDEIISGTPIEQLDELIEKLGYKDNDTLQTTNEHEVAFGEWNASSTDIEASGQTIFSIGIGTSAHDRKNAFEVRKDGTMYAWVEGGYVELTKILAQLTNELYDSDSSNNG